MTNVKIFFIVIIVLILGVLGTATYRAGNNGSSSTGELDSFAQCLADQGAVFYGAFWCPNCQNQKKMFGSSAKLLKYVECSTLDAKSQLPQCREENITGYPTWEFADGSRLTGQIPLLQLAEKTGCVLPGSASSAETAPVDLGVSSSAVQ